MGTSKGGMIMKNVDYLRVKDKEILKKLGYNPKEFLRLKNNAEGFEYLQIKTGKILSIRG
jgi:hypothetical protein